ncbi:chaperone NapD [Roseibium sp. MMSF_3412]|uniref:chaperone NapD n=1 Tax=Roseibium sp. MMSF_3412 TaxID=3046712 RepID=UPI00273D3169|nr:chaperone NapD [Roseibium sp. MMSF_3412]
MNICGCLVHAAVLSLPGIRDRVEAMNGVEIHASDDEGRLVVVVEDTETNTASELIMQLHQIPGVLSVTLTYHHFEDLAAPQAASLPAKSSQAGDKTHDHL